MFVMALVVEESLMITLSM